MLYDDDIRFILVGLMKSMGVTFGRKRVYSNGVFIGFDRILTQKDTVLYSQPAKRLECDTGITTTEDETGTPKD